MFWSALREYLEYEEGLDLECTDSGHEPEEALAEIAPVHPEMTKQGGARKNRTFDLSIISVRSNSESARSSLESPLE
jgi:hypothetical protein